MKTLTLKLPETLNLDERELKIFLACKLYEKGTLTLGQSAELAECTKTDFMNILGNYGVSLFNYSPEELRRELNREKKSNL